MKSLRNLLAISLFGLFFGCGTMDKKDPGNILRSAPYAGLTDSIEQFPNNPDLYSARAILLSQHDLHELATPDYKKAWELQPNETVALEYVSNLLLANKPREAINLLKECIATYPGNTEMNRRLSEIYAQTGQDERAVEQYDQLLAKDSMNFETWYERGVLLSQLNDTAGAIQSLERSYSLQPLNQTGLALASLYASTLNPKVLPFCDSLASRDTTGILNDVLYLKGMYYSDTKQFDKAMALFEECIRRDWKFVDAHLEKGIILYDQKKYDQALQVFKLANTVANTNTDTYYWMARAYEAQGNNEQALTNYKRALALDRTNRDAAEGIQRLEK